MKTILFVGISNKRDKDPFDSSTNSGKIIDSIVRGISCDCYKMNYVSYPPLDDLGRLRYPTKEELRNSFPEFQKKVQMLHPDLIIVCGKMILKELERHEYKKYPILSILHPSYIWVYHRKELDQYIKDTKEKIKEVLNLEK